MTRLSERIAADVLKASGSGLQNYTMNGSRERIIEAASVADDLLEALRITAEELDYFVGFARAQCEFEGDADAGLSAVQSAREAITKATGAAS